MNKTKKYLVVEVAIMFLVLSIFPSITAGSEKTFVPQLKNSEEPNKIITLCRIGPNWEITPVEVSIRLDEGQSLEEAIADKCQELYENDEELKELLDPEFNFIDWEIKASGKGFHLSFLLRLPIFNRSVLWRSLIRYKFIGGDDYTMIKVSGEWEMWDKGPHSARVLGFRGYVHFTPDRLLFRRFFGDLVIHGYYLQVSTW